MSFLDERFFEYRRRSTSTAGIIGGMMAVLLFAYRFFVDHLWNWDLFAIGATVGGVKLALMAWYYLKN
ncbi:MAG: hypothetical protein ACJ74H_02185 [Thermoanaerobaculia bacterium]